MDGERNKIEGKKGKLLSKRNYCRMEERVGMNGGNKGRGGDGGGSVRADRKRNGEDGWKTSTLDFRSRLEQTHLTESQATRH